MPSTKIELRSGRDKNFLIKLKNAVMDCVVETLRLPEKDRNIRVIEHDAELFETKPPYEVIIEISMFSGRTKETKRNLFSAIGQRLECDGLFDRKQILIIINEQPRENWGVRGCRPADEVDLGFKVEI